jgi:hypothetical protein
VHISFDRGRIVLSADFFLRSDPQEH